MSPLSVSSSRLELSVRSSLHPIPQLDKQPCSASGTLKKLSVLIWHKKTKHKIKRFVRGTFDEAWANSASGLTTNVPEDVSSFVDTFTCLPVVDLLSPQGQKSQMVHRTASCTKHHQGYQFPTPEQQNIPISHCFPVTSPKSGLQYWDCMMPGMVRHDCWAGLCSSASFWSGHYSCVSKRHVELQWVDQQYRCTCLPCKDK